MSEKVLLVEDNLDLVEPVRTQVLALGCEFDHASDGQQGLDLALKNQYSLILLDLVLPELEGIEVCKGIREHNKQVPIMMLTSKSDEFNKVLLLELGADDYLTKPYSVLELKARIKALLRRSSISQEISTRSEETATFGELSIDFTRRKIKLGDKPIDLTAREFDLVAILASRPGHPFTRDQLNEGLYGYQVSGYERSINSHMTRIRRKLEPDPRNPKYILTVRGVGYCMAEDT